MAMCHTSESEVRQCSDVDQFMLIRSVDENFCCCELTKSLNLAICH